MNDLKAFVRSLAAELPGWELDEGYYPEYSHMACMVNPQLTGARIYCNEDRRGRVKISGGYPHGFAPYHEDEVRISVSLDRAAPIVARDIQRRFLGAYLESFNTAMETAYRVAQAQIHACDLADELAAILGCGAQHGQDRAQIWSTYGTFTVIASSDGPYVHLERLHSISPELARNIARLFAEN